MANSITIEASGVRALSQVSENVPKQATDVTSSDDWNAALFTPIKQPSTSLPPEDLLFASKTGGQSEEAESVQKLDGRPEETFAANFAGRLEEKFTPDFGRRPEETLSPDLGGRPEETFSPHFGGRPEETFSPNFGGRPQELGVTPVREMEAFVESQVHALGPMRASIDSSDTEEEARKLGNEFVSDEGHAAAHARLAELLQAEKENALLRQHIESLKDKELDLALESGKEEVRRQAEMQAKYHQDMEAAAQEIERLRAQCSRLGGVLQDKNAEDVAREVSERELLDLLAIVQENVQLSKQVHEEAGRAGYEGQLSPEDGQLFADDAQLLPEDVQLAGEASQDFLKGGNMHKSGKAKGQKMRPRSAGEASDVAWSKGTVVFTPALGRLDGDLLLPEEEQLVTASDDFVRGMHKGRSNGRMTARIRHLERQLAEAQALLKASHPLPQAEPTEEMQELLLVVVERMERQIEELTKENQRLRTAATEPSPRSHLDVSVNSPISDQEADGNVPLLEWRTERALRKEVGQLAELVLEMEARVSEAEAGEAQAKEECDNLKEELQEWEQRATGNEEELKQAQAQIKEQQLEVIQVQMSLLAKQQALESALESGEQKVQGLERISKLRLEEAERRIAQKEEELMTAGEVFVNIQQEKEALAAEVQEARTLLQEQSVSLETVQKVYADTQLKVESLETQLEKALQATAESEALIVQKDEALGTAQDASNRLQRKLEILESELGVTHNLLEESERARRELEEGGETTGDVMLTSQLEAAVQEAEGLRGQVADALGDLVGAQEREEMAMQELERGRKEGEGLEKEIGLLRKRVVEGEAKMRAVLDELERVKEEWERWQAMLEVADREKAVLQNEGEQLREQVLGLKDELESQLERAQQERVVLEQGYAASERLAESKLEALRSEIEELQQNLADAEKRMVELEKEMARCQEKIGQLEAEVAQKGRSLNGAEQVIAGLRIECEEGKTEAETLKSERDGLSQKLVRVKKELASTWEEAALVLLKNDGLQQQLALNREEKAALEGQLEIAFLEVSVLQKSASEVKRDLEASVLSLEASQVALSREREAKENVEKALQSTLEKLDKSAEVSELQSDVSQLNEQLQIAEEKVGRLEKELLHTSEHERELTSRVAECELALRESKEKEVQLRSHMGECEKSLQEGESERASLDEQLSQAVKRMTEMLEEREKSLQEAARCREDLLRASERAIILSKQVGESEAAVESTKQEAREKTAHAESHVADVVRQLTEAQEQQAEMRETLSEAELALNESEERAQVAEEEAGRASEELEKMRLEVEQARKKLSNEQQRMEDALEKARIEWQDDMECLLDATEQRYSQGFETALANAKMEWEKETELLVAETQRESSWEAEKERAAFEEKEREVERLERELEIKREGLESLRAEKEDWEGRMDSKLKELSTLNGALEREKTRAELQRTAAEEVEKEKRGLRKEIDRVSALLETAQDQNHKISNMVIALEKQLGDKQEEIELIRMQRQHDSDEQNQAWARQRNNVAWKESQAEASKAMLQRQLDDALKLGEEALSGIEEKDKILAELTEQVNGIERQFKKQVNENERQVEALQAQLGEALSALESAKEEADLAESRAVQMEREMSELRKQRAEMNAALAEACKEREDALQDQEEARTELESVQNELENVQKKLDDVQEEFANACTENEQLRKSLTISEAALAEREEELELIEEESEKRAVKMRTLESAIEALHEDLKANEEKAEGLLAEKTAIEEELNERNEEVRERLWRMEETERGLREELLRRNEEAALLNQTVAKLEQSSREKVDAANLLREELEAQIKVLEDDVARSQGQHVAASEELTAVEKELEAMSKAWEAGKKVIEALQEQLAATECEVAEGKKKLSEALSKQKQEVTKEAGVWVGVLTAWYYASKSRRPLANPKEATLEKLTREGKVSEPIVEGCEQKKVPGDQEASSSEPEVAAAKRLLSELREQSERLHCQLAGLAVDEPRQHDVTSAACASEGEAHRQLQDLLKRLQSVHVTLLEAQDRESQDAPADVSKSPAWQDDVTCGAVLYRESRDAPADVSTPPAQQDDVTCGAVFDQVLALLKENTQLWAKVRMLPSLPSTLEALYAASLGDLETLVSQHRSLQKQLQAHVQNEQLNSELALLSRSPQAENLHREERSKDKGQDSDEERESRSTENGGAKLPKSKPEVELRTRGQESATWHQSDGPLEESVFGLESEGRAWFNPVFAVEEECAQIGEDSKVADLMADRDKLLRQNGRLVIELESLKTRLVAAEDALQKARAESNRLSELDIAYGQLVKELERVWKEKEGLQQRVADDRTANNVRTADTLRTDDRRAKILQTKDRMAENKQTNDRTAEIAGELGLRTPEKTARKEVGVRSDKKRRLNFEEGNLERKKESALEMSRRAAQILETGGGGESWGIRDVLERVLDENRRLQDPLAEQSTAVSRLSRQSRHDAKRAKRVEAECRTLTSRLHEQGLRLETVLKENADISHRLGRKELAVAALQRHIKVLSKENRNVHDALKEREGRIKELEQHIKRRE